MSHKGILNINKYGFGIIKSNKFNKKIKVDKKNLNNNIDNEEVIFEIIKEHDFCIYAKVISEPNLIDKQFTGIFHHNYINSCFIYSKKFGKNNLIMCDKPNEDINDGDLFNFTIKKFKNKKFYGKINNKIGNFFNKDSITTLLINEYNLNNDFNDKIIKKLKKIINRYNNDFEIESKNRTDLTNITTFTIDPNGARDLDDAISVIEFDNKFKVYINIADVSYFVKPNTSIDKEALKRSFSVYLPTTVIRMLPPELSENLCSLLPNTAKYAVTTEVDISKKGKILNWKIYKSIIESKYKFTYEEVYDIITNNKDHFLKNDLIKLKTVSDLIRKNRLRLPNKTYDDSLNIKLFYNDFSHSMIEELMILNNILAAKELSKRGIHYPSRYHPEPDLEMTSNNLFLLEKINNVEMNNVNVNTIQNVIDNTDNKIINLYLIRTILSKATYDHKKKGHWALDLKFYSHFTSPIRRYPDLITHRLIFEYNINNNKLNDCLYNINKNEQEYQKIEFYMEDILNFKHIKENEEFYKNKILKGIITRVSNPTITIFIEDIFYTKDFHIGDISKIKMNFDDKKNIFFNNDKIIQKGDIINLKINKIRTPFLDIIFDFI